GQAGIELGSYIHLGVGVTLIGAGKIVLNDYSALSSRVAIYSSSDDYGGEFMTNPMVPEAFTNVHHADVIVGRHVSVGAGSVILPGVDLGEGAAIGALSLVASSCDEFSIYAGTPARKVRPRKRDLLDKEKEMQSCA